MALGMIEVFGFATAIVVADAMAKAADVEIVAIDKNKPAAGDSARVPLVMAVKAEGSAAAVEAAVAAGKAEAEKKRFVHHSQGDCKAERGHRMVCPFECPRERQIEIKNKK